jgi:N-acetyl-D-muramate 6-phosphate phosphatase
MLQKTPKAVLFDLDGTLCESLPGLLHSLNELLKEHQKPLLQPEELRGQADKGSLAMITYSFKITAKDPQTEPLRQEFLQRYIANMAEYTHYFPQVEETLNYLKQQHIPWGIVTNRPAFLMPPLIKKYDLNTQAACLIFGDTLTTSKPEPDMLQHACTLLNTPAEECIYVGDTENDLIAAQRANMPAVFAEYGYLRAESKRESLHYQARLKQPSDLITLLQHTQ